MLIYKTLAVAMAIVVALWLWRGFQVKRRRVRAIIPQLNLTPHQAQRLAQILRDEGISHHPLAGDHYFFRGSSPDPWQWLLVTDETLDVADSFWIPNRGQLKMLLASLGLQCDAKPEDGRFRTFAIGDPTLSAIGTTRDESLFRTLDLWAERREAERNIAEERAQAEARRMETLSPFSPNYMSEIFGHPVDIKNSEGGQTDMLPVALYQRIAEIMAHIAPDLEHQPQHGDTYIYPRLGMIDEWSAMRLSGATSDLPADARWIPLGDTLLSIARDAGIRVEIHPAGLGAWIPGTAIRSELADRDEAIVECLEKWIKRQNAGRR